MRSLAYGSRLQKWALWSGVCIYTYLGGTPSVSELWVFSLSSGGAGGVLGLGGASCGGGAPVPLRLQRVCRLGAVPFWQGRLPSVWFSRTIAVCPPIASFTPLYMRNTTLRIFACRTSALGFLISCCVSSIAAHKNPSLAILAIIKARHMSDYSSCTRPPFLAIVAVMLETYKNLVAASRWGIGFYLNHTRLCNLL